MPGLGPCLGRSLDDALRVRGARPPPRTPRGMAHRAAPTRAPRDAVCTPPVAVPVHGDGTGTRQ